FAVRVAERVGRGVAALQAHLVRPKAIGELHEEVLVDAEVAIRLGIDLHHPTLDAVGIELRIPGRIQGVGDVHAAAVAAHLDHLRRAVERRLWRRRMRGSPYDAPNLDLAGEYRVER